jgi:hypothetical protein
MAVRAQNAVLKWGASSPATITGLAIKGFPDLGGAPETIETTTLSDAIRTYVLGIQAGGVMEFRYNYAKALYTTIKTDANTAMNYSLTLEDASVIS